MSEDRLEQIRFKITRGSHFEKATLPYSKYAIDAIDNDLPWLASEVERLRLNLHNTEHALEYERNENQRVRMQLMPILESEDPAEYVEKMNARIAVLEKFGRDMIDASVALLVDLANAGEWPDELLEKIEELKKMYEAAKDGPK